MDREIAPVVMLMEGAGGDDRLMSVISGLACVISAGIKEILDQLFIITVNM